MDRIPDWRVTAGELRKALDGVPDGEPVLVVVDQAGGQVSGWVRRVQHDAGAGTFALRARTA